MRYKIETERENLFDVNMVIAMRVRVEGKLLYEDLEKAFDNGITDALRLLTHDKSEPYWTYVDRIKNSGNKLALAVKTNDLKHNIIRGTIAGLDTSKHQKALRILEG